MIDRWTVCRNDTHLPRLGLTGANNAYRAPVVVIAKFRNKHYNVPHSVNLCFTGRHEVCEQLQKSCLPSKITTLQTVQKRFVLYGLAGSGKTQLCLKFAQDNREE